MNILKSLSAKALLAVFFWGASFIATRIGLRSFTPVGLLATRMVLAALALALVAVVRRRPILPATDRKICVLLGVILGVHLLVQAIGLQYTTAINTAWIVGFMPVFIAVGSIVFGLQRLRAKGWIGVGLSTIGVFLVTLTELPEFDDARFGDYLQMSTCFSWAAYSLLAVGPLSRNDPLAVTTLAMGAAAIATCVLTPWYGWTVASPNSVDILCVLFLGVLCGGVANWLWNAAMQERGPTSTSVHLYAEPFVALLLAVWILNEPSPPLTLAGGVLVLIGVGWVGEGTKARSSSSTPPEQKVSDC